MKIGESTILITGVSGGIGGAIAERLAGRGASLLVVDRDAGRAAAHAAALRRQGAKEAWPLVGDLGEPGTPA